MSDFQKLLEFGPIGYRKPPKYSRFKPGQSGNPNGRPKKAKPNTLPDAIAAKLASMVTVSKAHKRLRVSAKQLFIRKLAETAAGGDRRALVELVRLSYETWGIKSLRPWKVVSFNDAIDRKGWEKLDDKFFAEQDRKKAEWSKALREGMAPIGLYVAIELARKVHATRNGKRTKVPMLDVIASRFMQEANEDPKLLKLLLKIIPAKSQAKPSLILEIERPSESQKEYLAEMLQKEAEQLKEIEEEIRASAKPPGVGFAEREQMLRNILIARAQRERRPRR
jgi:hypothetical protein